MQLEHSFTVPTGIDDAWRILLDIEQIGPCMPGAAIDSVDGDDFTGTVKVKLGPINLTYKGKASFVEKDEAAHRAVIDARGRDARGNGTASAKVTATLSESGGQTVVDVLTDLDITGKPAQFGRGVMVDVGNKLIGQFADSLADVIRGDQAGTTAAAGKTGAAKSAAKPASRTSAAKPTAAKTTARKAAAKKATPAKKSVPAAASASGETSTAPAAGTAPAAEGYAAGAESPSAVDPVAEEPTVPPPADDPTADEQATPAYGVPGGLAAPEPDEEPSVNGHSTSSPQRPQREVEPIDLLQSAGPAVAKRVVPVLAPVAVALVVVLAAQRRRRKR